MATRSLIGAVFGDKLRFIYCHLDGYPEGVGALLITYYTDITKIKTLIDLGDISSLGKCTGQKQCDSDGVDDYTVAYHRDREDCHLETAAECINIYEKTPLNIPGGLVRKKRVCDHAAGILPRWAMDQLGYSAAVCGAEYCYVFRNDKWHFYSVADHESGKLTKIS